MPLTYKTPAYFLDFQCLGERCEDTCCQQWEVRLDRKHFHRLQEQMQNRPDSQALFEKHIRLNDGMVSGDHDYARIEMAADGYCAMLDDKGLCRIHREFGTEPLGNVCAFFPRILSRCGNEIELSGALSCPEVVRRCLLDPRPIRYVRFSPTVLPRPADYPIHRQLPATPDDHYARHFKTVRQALLKLAAGEDGLETRLYALATFAHQLSDFYHRGCDYFDAAQLAAVLAKGTAADTLREMAGFLHQYQAGEPVALIVIVSILQIKQQQFSAEPISVLADRIMADYLQEHTAGGGTAVAPLEIPIGELQARFEARRAACQATYGQALDDMLGRYLGNCLYREWFYTMPDT